MNFRQRHSDGATAVDSPGIIRRTTIELGPLRITREYHLASGVGRAVHVAPPRSAKLRTIGLLGILCAASAGGLAVAATKVAPRADYSISLPVPVATVAPLRSAARPAAAARARRARVERPASARADGAVAATDDLLPPGPAVAADDRIADRAAAIATALRTGEVQEWTDAMHGTRGYVVAGVADQAGGRSCRLLSVLTRSWGGIDRVEQRRECLPGASG